MRVNWHGVTQECGVNTLRDFQRGSVSGTQFSRQGPTCRRLVRQFGVNDARARARFALYRRLIKENVPIVE